VVDLTADTRQVAWGIGQIGGGGMTDIFDALADAVSYLQTEAPAQRRVVILVSDNTPTVESRVSAQEVTRMALQAECAIYSIQTPGARALPQFRRPGRVEEIARETGGEVIGTQRAGSVGAALAAVMRRLKTRYTLGYYPSNKAHDGTFRVIEVYLGDRFGQLHLDYRILARRGYYAPREGVTSQSTLQWTALPSRRRFGNAGEGFAGLHTETTWEAGRLRAIAMPESIKSAGVLA